jgi:tight adherence protein B
MGHDKLFHYLLPAAAFLTIAAAWVVVVVLWSARRRRLSDKIQRRIGLIQDSNQPVRMLRLWHEGKEAVTYVPGMPRRNSMAQRIAHLCRDTGWRTPPGMILAVLAGVCVFAVVVVLTLSHNVLLAAAAPVVVSVLFWLYLKQCIAKREMVFDQQFIDALDLAARSLRAGHPLLGAFRVISDEIPAPVGNIFGEICQQQGIGVSVEDALRRAAGGLTSLDLKLFATSVTIQMRTGGNLTEMMERLATVIRGRMWLTRRIRVLTAQTQFSKRLLLVLPFLLFFVLNLINPHYMEPLYHTWIGQMMLLVAGAGLLIGAWVMNRMAVLKY